jgi:DNA invertase Pin-like site-specific DNA recombinase
MNQEGQGKRRCAIYTRKSTEEGLEQSFNSLDAQREACAAYIRSQAGEGWRLIPHHYDDGGFSGGNMDRPALKRLLADIDTGGVDIVVVYKVDRLTRSLTDFARIVERFEARKVSFVSVTQSFNTTSSMGRLTLNVLLSFAQFEREVTGERIRDKIAASKAKGLWMGGFPPLGYDPNGRTLAVNKKEAETVRMIFRRYLELGCVRALVTDLKAAGIRSKSWTTAKGRRIQGSPLVRGALYHMLRNRLYRGEIRHGKTIHPGQHQAIIDAALFEAAQTSLDGKVRARRERPTKPGGSPLTGLLYDSADNRMTPTHARGKSGGAYRYYTSATATSGRSNVGGELTRVPAKSLEKLVVQRLGAIVGQDVGWDRIRAILERVIVRKDSVEIQLRAKALPTNQTFETLPPGDTVERDTSRITITIPIMLKRRGGSVRILDAFGRSASGPKAPDPNLTRAVARAHGWRSRLVSGQVSTIAEIAHEENFSEAFVRVRLRLAYLSPEITSAILTGLQPEGLNVEQIIDADFPLEWRAQRRAFEFNPERSVRPDYR